MKNALYPVALIAILVALYFFVIKTPSNSGASLNRIFEPVRSMKLVKDVKFDGDIYRLLAKGDSLTVIASPNAILISDKTFNHHRQIKGLKDEGTLYDFTVIDDTLFYFDVDRSRLTAKSPGFLSQFNLPDSLHAGQATYHYGEFIYSAYSKMADSVSIFSFNPVTRKNSLLVQLNSTMQDKLMQNACDGSALEGNFLSISPNKWCHLFFMGGYFLIYENGKVTVHQTIDRRPFKKFEERKVELGGGRTAFMCKAETDNFYNYQAATDGKYLYILSGVIESKKGESLSTPIDAYDINTFEYKFTLGVPLASVEDYAYQLAVSGDYFYIYSARSKLKIYQNKK